MIIADAEETVTEIKSQNITSGAQNFYGSILPPTGYRVLAVFKNGLKSPPLHEFHATDAALIASAMAHDAKGINVYHACASYAEPTSRKGANVEAVKALWADLDVGPGKAYATRREAVADFSNFVKALNLPPPAVVLSGNGVHFYFPFTTPLVPDEWDKLAAMYETCLDHFKVKHDPSRTTDKASILRVPGTQNYKDPANPKAVQLKSNVVESSPVDLAAKFQAYIAQYELIPSLPKTTARKPLAINDIVGNHANNYPLADASKIEQECPAVAQVAQTGGDCTFPLWRAVAGGLAKYCEQPDEVAARWTRNRKSTGHDQDDYEAQMASWNTPPATCKEIAKHSGACQSCRHRAKVNSPVTLGYPAPSPTSVVVPPSTSSPEPLETTSSGQTALAAIFLHYHRDRFRFDHSARQWRIYRNGSWSLCNKGEPTEAMKDVAARLLVIAGATLVASAQDPTQAARAAKLQKLALMAQDARNITYALKLAESDPRVAVTADEFDNDDNLLNAANCVVDLKTGKALPHDPGRLMALQSPVIYDTEASCPLFAAFIQQISCNDPNWVAFMQTFLGYTLGGSVQEEKMSFWYGTGRNGKSVLANVLRHILGPYAGIAPASMFMTSQRDGEASTPFLATLPGKRLLLANETEAGSRLSAQTLKIAVSTEHIAARKNHGNPFSFKPTHKTIMRGNHLPQIREGDEGTWRRIDMVPFDLQLTPDMCDPDLEQKLIAEAPGILRWLVEGHLAWRARGITPCARVQAASAEYRRASDVVGQWLDDCCEVRPSAEVEQSIAYANYSLWVRAEGCQPYTKSSFTKELTRRGFTSRRASTGRRAWMYGGLKLS